MSRIEKLMKEGPTECELFEVGHALVTLFERRERHKARTVCTITTTSHQTRPDDVMAQKGAFLGFTMKAGNNASFEKSCEIKVNGKSLLNLCIENY